jgi:hypothetical protein
MIAGILDAARSEYSPATRLVWICIENNVNRARIWVGTDEDIAAEMHLSVDTVAVAVAALAGDKIIAVKRHKRRRTVFKMLRNYPDGCVRPRHEPEVAARVAPELTREIPDSTPELTPEIPETLESTSKKDPLERGTRARADGLTPAAPPMSASMLEKGEGKEARRIEEEPDPMPEPPAKPPVRRSRPHWTPLPPDDWEPEPEVIEEVLAIGYSRDDLPMLRDMLFDWHTRLGRGSCNWSRELVAEARHHAKQRLAKRDRRAETDAWLAKMHAKHGIREGDVIVGVAL